MSPTSSRSLFATGTFAGLMLLGGCATVDHSAYFEAHEASFRSHVDYATHDVPRDGHRLHAREFGRPDDRPTLVLMHGFPDSMHLYDWLVPLLADDRHIIAFDFLGWGDSDKPGDHRYDVASLYRDLEVVVDYFDLHRVVLVVHDASGQPGIDWALANPGRTAGLVLLNTYYGPSPTLRAPEAIARFSTPGLYRDLSVIATRLFDSLWMRGWNQQIARFLSTEELREPFQRTLGHQSLGIRRAFYRLNRVLNEEVMKRADTTPLLAAFDPPVRIIFGNDDPYLNAGVARDLDSQFGNSELFLLEGAGHFVQVDAAAKVADLLRDFPSAADYTD